MSNPSVCVRDVWKKFRRGEAADTLRDLIVSLFSRRRPASTLARDEFWAVRELSFAVQPGEALGVIGPNGAGKSTLLKLLAGIIRPDAGQCEIAGPVSALIELGAGFHPDLTGEENIYLNGAILGMSRRDIRRRFGEIVAFADIGGVLTTPVKRYSSGMTARLGFAIAAHVSPRVLLVDEVLSVGDRVFRARCMEKMRRFLNDGVAIIFVSHDLSSVASFCPRTLVMARGAASFCGPTREAISQYYEAFTDARSKRDPRGRRAVRISNQRVVDACGRDVRAAEAGQPLTIEFDAWFDVAMAHPSFGLSLIRTDDHLVVFETSSTRMSAPSPAMRPGECTHVRYDIRLNLSPAEYAIGLHVRDRDALDYAFQQACVAQLMVTGAMASSCPAFLAPRVQVTTLTAGEIRTSDDRAGWHGQVLLPV